MQGYQSSNPEVLVGVQGGSKENTLGGLEKSMFTKEQWGFGLQGYCEF